MPNIIYHDRYIDQANIKSDLRFIDRSIKLFLVLVRCTHMVDHYLSDEGKKRFGQFLRKVMADHKLGNLREFAEFLTERSGLEVKFNRLQRLIKGHYDDATVTLLLPLVKARVLKFPNGNCYSFDDIVAVLTGELDPETGKRSKQVKNGNGR